MIQKKFYNEQQGIISGEIDFVDKSELSFMEFIDTGNKKKIKYKYHYMDSNKNLIFRYDNAMHHPEINTFPHHKHVEDDIEESTEPEMIDVLSEIQKKLTE
ncbi:MAG: hypothetical protein HC831_11055 [Chloroflexia bacterium]|nr:hypothetical protein [Chloroflexia bacterium]